MSAPVVAPVATEAVAAEAATQLSALQQLDALVERNARLAAELREINRGLLALRKTFEREQRRATKTKTKRKVEQKPVAVTKPMREFLVKHASAEAAVDGYTRREMMKALSDYVKLNNLQSKDNKKQWTPDATLAKLLDLDRKQAYSFMNLNGLISRVVVKPTPAATTA